MVGETCAIGGCYILVSASLTPGQHWESHELFFFLVLFGGIDCMFQTVCITVIYLFLCTAYYFLQQTRIAFNKYLMNAERFPYAKAMTAMHMLMTTLLSLVLYTVAPSLYPTMGKAKENWRTATWLDASLKTVLFSGNASKFNTHAPGVFLYVDFLR